MIPPSACQPWQPDNTAAHPCQGAAASTPRPGTRSRFDRGRGDSPGTAAARCATSCRWRKRKFTTEKAKRGPRRAIGVGALPMAAEPAARVIWWNESSGRRSGCIRLSARVAVRRPAGALTARAGSPAVGSAPTPMAFRGPRLAFSVVNETETPPRRRRGIRPQAGARSAHNPGHFLKPFRQWRNEFAHTTDSAPNRAGRKPDRSPDFRINDYQSHARVFYLTL